MKKIVFMAVMLISDIVKAQTNNGIHFENTLSWPEIVAKAKTENKYIFVDCYASWCGPCKQMDKEIYSLKKVGEIYNKEFICLKVQMDKTSNDDAEKKSWYRTATVFEVRYHVNSYPTFLFFSPNGTPVHKVSGTKGVSGFIQLARNAKDPQKQYFTLVKNFQPGKLDTAELKSLARMFRISDKDLGGRMALDYLHRIPDSVLATNDNLSLMAQFQDNKDVLRIADDYLSRLNDSDIIKPYNANFIEKLSSQTKAIEVAANYITGLKQQELSKPENYDFITYFQDIPKVQKTLKAYLDSLPEGAIYSQINLGYLERFTDNTVSKGFDVFYHHAAQVDSVFGRGDAERIAERIISNEEVKPILDSAKKTGTPPDFDLIFTVVSRKYNEGIAENIVANAKVSWYRFWVVEKRQEQFWPEFNAARYSQIEKFKTDTQKAATAFMNNICYGEFFLHSTNRQQLLGAVRWMAETVEQSPDNSVIIDTYACVLYKAGQVHEAIDWEEKALHIATRRNDRSGMALYPKTLAKMRSGEKIWLEKEYLDN